MALIEMKSITKDYHLGETVVSALKGVDLQIYKKEFLAIWGPSGSGKTTLLNLICAIDEPTTGKLTITGKDFRSLTYTQKNEYRIKTIGFISQGFSLVPALSAWGNVMLPLLMNGVSAAEAEKQSMRRLEEFGLSDIIYNRPEKMTGEQQQMVSIVRALVNNPSLVIADEPTANLDSEAARMIIDLMCELNERHQTTFIFSTHDQRLLDRVKRLVRLEDGKIVNGGTKQDYSNSWRMFGSFKRVNKASWQDKRKPIPEKYMFAKEDTQKIINLLRKQMV
jgi:putative ABC transport system ATP-binding protein